MNEIVAVPSRNTSQLVDAALAGLLGELREKSRPMYEVAVRDFWKFAVEGRLFETGTPPASVLSQYIGSLQDRGLKGSSIQAKRVQLRRFFGWALKVGLINEAEYMRIKEVKAPKFRGQRAGHWLTSEQIDQLLAAPDTTTLAGRRDRAVLSLLVGAGLRRSEVCNLTWGHIVQERGVWVIRSMVRKHGNEQAYIVLGQETVNAIFAWSERGKDSEKVIARVSKYGTKGESLSPDGVLRIVKNYAERLGFGHLSPHDLRRSFAREFAGKATKNNVSMGQLQQQLGHQSIATTERYIAEMMDLDAIAGLMNQ